MWHSCIHILMEIWTLRIAILWIWKCNNNFYTLDIMNITVFSVRAHNFKKNNRNWWHAKDTFDWTDDYDCNVINKWLMYLSGLSDFTMTLQCGHWQERAIARNKSEWSNIFHGKLGPIDVCWCYRENMIIHS